MNKKELISDMKKTIGASFITRNELARYMNLKDPASVDRYLYGLPRLNSRYFIPDVAERMMEQLEFRR